MRQLVRLGITTVMAIGLSACADTDDSASIRMVPIPAGSFEMGCQHENHCIWTEKPAHSVQIKAFNMAATETTWAQYQACISAGACRKPSAINDNYPATHPAIYLNQDDINTYIQWLNKATGQSYRLPSEAEWEYAARAGSTSAYSWGDTARCDKALFNNENGQPCTEKPINNPTAVGRYPANTFGLYDMHGNVRELVADCWNNNYTQAPTDGSAWLEGKCYKVILRGGAWNLGPEHMRAAYRHRGLALARANTNGFRLAQSLSE